jgi:hypothetical protein
MLSPMDQPNDFFTIVPTDAALMTPPPYLLPGFPVRATGSRIVRSSINGFNELAFSAV